MHFSCRAGNIGSVAALLSVESIDRDAITNAGVTPLMCAIESANLNLVVQCLNGKMQPFLKDVLNRSALDYARHFNNV